jgi:hypothetical protein
MDKETKQILDRSEAYYQSQLRHWMEKRARCYEELFQIDTRINILTDELVKIESLRPPTLVMIHNDNIIKTRTGRSTD